MIKTICFTGHRKFEGQYSHTPTHNWVREKIENAIKRAFDNGFDNFISGGAIGTDLIAAQEVINFRLSHPVTLTIAIPFEGQESRWPPNRQEKYREILAQANEVVYINSGPYEHWKMMARNRWMVDNSDCVIAIWDGRNDGETYQTIQYAKQDPTKWIYHIEPISGLETWLQLRPT